MHTKKTLSESLNNCSRELQTLVVQYGSACLLGSKDAAIKLNGSIQECLASLQALVDEVTVLEREQRLHSDIIDSLEESSELS